MAGLQAVADKLKQVQALLLDVDGVLTDGGIIYTDNGHQTKVFDVKDGLGIRMALDAGLDVCIVTGRQSGALAHRCKDLGIEHVFEGVRQKTAVLRHVSELTGAPPANMAFMADDLPDLALMRAVGLSIAVADAHETVKASADAVTSALGGHGAVREVCEFILQAQGRWGKIMDRW